MNTYVMRAGPHHSPLIEKITTIPTSGNEFNPLKIRLQRADADFIVGMVTLHGSTGGASACSFGTALSQRCNVFSIRSLYSIQVTNVNLRKRTMMPDLDSVDLVMTSPAQHDHISLIGNLSLGSDIDQVSIVPGSCAVFMSVVDLQSLEQAHQWESTLELRQVPHLSAASPLSLVSPEARRPEIDDFLPQESGDRALMVARQLQDFFGLTDEGLGDLVDIGRTTIASWRSKKQRRQPRASTVAPLLEFGALLAALRDRLGDAEARLWFARGKPTRLETLKTDRDSVFRAANDIIFANAVKRSNRGFEPEPNIEVKTGVVMRPMLKRRAKKRVHLLSDRRST